MEEKFGDGRVFGVRRKVFYPVLGGMIVILLGVLIASNISGDKDTSPHAGQKAITHFEEEESNTQEPLRPGMPAPPINLKTISGQGSSSFDGKPTLVEFVATWCPHCQKMAPVIDRALTKVPTNFVMVGAAGEPDLKVKRFHRSFLKWPMKGIAVNDPDESVTDAYNVAAYPTLAFIDKRGDVVAFVSGERSQRDIVRLLKESHQ